MVKSIILSLALLAFLAWGIRQYSVHMRTDKRLEELDDLAKKLVKQDFRDMFKAPSNTTQLTTKVDDMPVSLSPDDTRYLQQCYITLFQQAMHEHYQKQATEQETEMLLKSFRSIRDAHVKAALTIEQHTGKL